MNALIDVWSDYVCPFCYLEEPVLDRLARESDHKIEINWRAFELRPEPVPTLDPRGEYLTDIWERAVYPMAHDRGMNLQLPPIQPRSRLALEAAEFAKANSEFAQMHSAIFKAFFEEGRDIGDLETIVQIGQSIEVDTDALRKALVRGEFRARVLENERLAMRLGISGVPAILIRREGEPIESAVHVSGAQPYEQLRAALEHLLGK